MGTATFIEDFKEGLEFVPVEGRPNLFFIHTRQPSDSAREKVMTPKDWNEFERHIGEIRAR
jgi:hypothetical protein